jgi:protein-L-isoaspartate(D-aspartate) O-methyltransferase
MPSFLENGLRLFKKTSRRDSSTRTFESDRKAMVEDQIKRRGIADDRVLEAMRNVERHLFLEKRQWGSAYGDHPLSIGEGQTISQPYIVALMTEALGVEEKARVLEVGTGSGYQTAILAELVAEVFSIEILSTLAERARSRLDAMGYTNVQIRSGDGRFGWPEQAPFDGILVAAAPKDIPEALREQLKDGGRLVIPVGVLNQELEVHTRKGKSYTVENLASVRFVPFK